MCPRWRCRYNRRVVRLEPAPAPAQGGLQHACGLPSTTGTCGRNLTIPAPLPLTPALCGRPFSFQWVVRCRPTPNSPAGFGITNCLTFSVSGS